jgi:hypothetical protein
MKVDADPKFRSISTPEKSKTLPFKAFRQGSMMEQSLLFPT